MFTANFYRSWIEKFNLRSPSLPSSHPRGETKANTREQHAFVRRQCRMSWVKFIFTSSSSGKQKAQKKWNWLKCTTCSSRSISSSLCVLWLIWLCDVTADVVSDPVLGSLSRLLLHVTNKRTSRVLKIRFQFRFDVWWCRRKLIEIDFAFSWSSSRSEKRRKHNQCLRSW